MTISWTSSSLSERSRAKVKVTVAVFRKKTLCHHSSAFIDRPILILYHTNVEYDNILDITQMLSMTISGTSSSLSILGLRSRSQRLFLEKHCHRSSALIYYPISI